MWQKFGKGRKYRGMYLRDAKGERNFILVGLMKDGAAHTVTAESPEMMKKAGWIKTS